MVEFCSSQNVLFHQENGTFGLLASKSLPTLKALVAFSLGFRSPTCQNQTNPNTQKPAAIVQGGIGGSIPYKVGVTPSGPDGTLAIWGS